MGYRHVDFYLQTQKKGNPKAPLFLVFGYELVQFRKKKYRTVLTDILTASVAAAAFTDAAFHALFERANDVLLGESQFKEHRQSKN